MKHEFTITSDQREKVQALIDAASVFIDGKATFVEILQVQTEDERLAQVLDNLLNHNVNIPPKSGPGSATKVWTIIATGETMSQSGMTMRLTKKKITEGTILFHAERGNYVVDVKDNGKYTLKKMA
jgi:hypothetical protein